MVRVLKMRKERDDAAAEVRDRQRRMSRRVRRSLKEGQVEMLGTKGFPSKTSGG